MSYLRNKIGLKLFVFVIIVSLLFWLAPTSLLFGEDGEVDEETAQTGEPAEGEDADKETDESLEDNEDIAGDEGSEGETSKADDVEDDPATTEWYVSPDAVSNAEDFEDGNSSENPVSIDSVLSHIVDGDTLYFLSGTYTGTYTEDKDSNISLDNIGTGTEYNPISFVGYDQAIFDGGNTIDHAFSLTSPLSYLGFYNFTFINYAGSAIYIDNQEVTNIDIVDNTFAGNGTAIDVAMNLDLNIENNIIVDNNKGIDVSSDNASVEHNIVVDNGQGIKVDDTKDNVVLDYNDVYNNQIDYIGTEPGENDISVKPMFVDKEALDFSLQEDSPLIDNNIIRIVQTDKDDYRYNEQVIITGSGYSPDQELILKILRPDGTFVDDININADDSGNFVYDGYAVDYAGKNYLVKITDTDGKILEVLSFTDAIIFYVSTSGDDSYDGLASEWEGGTRGPKLTIQAAISDIDVVNEDTINVADGTYIIIGAITVNKEVTITGNVGSPENVVVTYSSPSQTLDCFDMQANDITVQGISVVNGRYGFNFAASDPTGCTISNCVIDHAYNGAINIDGGSGHTISNNTITNCLTSGDKRGVIHIYDCPDVTIDGNTLTDNGLTGNHATMGIYVKFTYPSSSSERVEIINNNISGMLGINADIQVYDAPYTYIYNNTISNSEDKGIAIFGIAGSPAYNSTDNRVEVIGNTISETKWGGIQACNAPYTYIYNNTINDTEDKGINIMDSGATSETDRVQVIGNIISETKWPGIQVIGSPYTYVYDNTLTKCNYYGGDGTGDFDYASIHIDTGSANCIIDNNTVSDGINGIQLWSDRCTITNNTIYDMGKTYANTKITGDGTYYNSAILYGDMYDVNMPTSATISNNNIYDNYWGLFVISAYTGTVTAENNWWGDNSGPTHTSNPGGTGDSVSDNVLFDPWTTHAAPPPPSTPLPDTPTTPPTTTTTVAGIIEVAGITELPFTGMNLFIPISGISTLIGGAIALAMSLRRRRNKK